MRTADEDTYTHTHTHARTGTLAVETVTCTVNGNGLSRARAQLKVKFKRLRQRTRDSQTLQATRQLSSAATRQLNVETSLRLSLAVGCYRLPAGERVVSRLRSLSLSLTLCAASSNN